MNAVARVQVAEAADGGDQQQYLTFRLGAEVFAMPILSVKEILEFGPLTSVPLMPECVRGVLNLRGRVVPVIDLSVRFGRQASTPTRRTCIVIVEVHDAEGQTDIGVIVDGVNQVVEIPASRIEPAPAFGGRVRQEFIAGMGRLDEGFVVILDGNRVLDVEDMAALRLGEHGTAAA